MSNAFYIPLPAYENPPGLDQNAINGISNQLAGIGQDRRENAMLALQQQAGTRANAELGLRQQAGQREQTAFNQDQTDRHVRIAAGIAQSVLAETDPAKRAAMLDQVRKADPEWDKDLAGAGFHPDNVEAWAPAVIARAQGYQDPMKRQMEEATLKKTNAETEALGRKDQWVDMFGKILAEPPATPAPAAAPSLQPQSFTPPQPNGPMLQPAAAVSNALAPQPAQPSGVQLVGDDTTDEAKALPEPGAANPSAVYNMPGDAVINTPMGQMTRDKARRLGMALSVGGKGDAGKMMMDAASGGDQRLGRNSVAANDKEEMGATNALGTLDTIKSQFNSKYLTIGNKFNQWGKAWYEKLGGTLAPQDKADLTQYTQFRQSSWHALNRVLKDLSGTAVTENEMQRQLRDMPNPGLGVMDGDSPTEFASKLKGTMDFAKSAVARARYLRANGFQGKPWEAGLDVGDMPKIINQRGSEIEQQLKQQNPKIDPGRLNTEVDKRIKQEFGI